MYALLLEKIHSSKLLLQCFFCLDACRKLESALPGELKKATRSRAVSVTEAIPGLAPNQASEAVCRYLQQPRAFSGEVRAPLNDRMLTLLSFNLLWRGFLYPSRFSLPTEFIISRVRI
jgi:hypothetical protein